MPVRDGLGGFLVHAETFDLREGNSHRAIAPCGLDHYFSETVSLVGQHSQHGHTLAKFQGGHFAGLDALGLEGERQLAFQITIPARPCFVFVVTVHNNFIGDALFALVLAFRAFLNSSRGKMLAPAQ